MDHNGEGKRLEQKDVLDKVLKPSKGKLVDLRGWGRQEMVLMCVTAGCDYLSSLPGYGIRKAYELVKRFRRMDRVLRTLEYRARAAKSVLPEGYRESFERAVYTYGHQTVFDPSSKRLRHLALLKAPEAMDTSFLGAIPETAAEMALLERAARGEICPCKRTEFGFMKRDEAPPAAQGDRRLVRKPWKQAAQPLQERSASSENVSRNKAAVGIGRFARKLPAGQAEPASKWSKDPRQRKVSSFFGVQSGMRRSQAAPRTKKAKSFGGSIASFFARAAKGVEAELSQTSEASGNLEARDEEESTCTTSATSICESECESSFVFSQPVGSDKASASADEAQPVAPSLTPDCQTATGRGVAGSASSSSSSRFFSSTTSRSIPAPVLAKSAAKPGDASCLQPRSSLANAASAPTSVETFNSYAKEESVNDPSVQLSSPMGKEASILNAAATPGAHRSSSSSNNNNNHNNNNNNNNNMAEIRRIDLAQFERKGDGDDASAAKSAMGASGRDRPRKRSRTSEAGREDWQCERCTLLNGWLKRKCMACGHSRPKTPVKPRRHGSRKSPRLAQLSGSPVAETPTDRSPGRRRCAAASVGTASSATTSSGGSFAAFAYSGGSVPHGPSPQAYAVSLSPPITDPKSRSQFQSA
eukprot:scaffold2808_cov255-Pinguiococcus_pyrenoidosus.AAC.39